jgi:crotonobetainyl-CoA:carnitine CoA-transferase CaiB-like acyl-CoA transferase
MSQVMKGIRVLEVAQFTFVPAAGGILADWGADVIKIEHPVRGDTQRGFINLGGIKLDPVRNALMEHPNRGKRSVGIDVSTPEGVALIYEIAKTADVFLTNYLPAQRKKLKIDLEDIRRANPNIIYARGSAYGDKGPERDIGGFDGTAFWSRGGIGHAMSPEELGGPLSQGIPAFGDSIGGMNIAGGISAALFHRERTGEALELDVSLMSTAWWAAGTSVDIGIEQGKTMRNRMPTSGGNPGNPFNGNYYTVRQRHDKPVHPDAGPLYSRHLHASGHPGSCRRPTLCGRAVADDQLASGERTHDCRFCQTSFRVLASASENHEGTVGASTKPD